MFFTAAEDSTALTHTILSWRPVAVVLFPLLAALLTAWLGSKNRAFASLFATAATVLTFIGVFSLYPLLQRGVLEYPFAGMMGFGILFRVDYLSFIFALLIALAWLAVMLFARGAIEEEKQQRLYFPFSLITMGSCLGVVMAGDLFSLFLFFELMTVSSFVLVIIRRTKEAIAAGLFTLYLGLAGGLVMLFGILALYHTAGTVEIRPLMEKLAAGEANLILLCACLFVGFGIKAVVVPLHLWIPRAYSVAPAAVNALSSGAMIKVGIYGLLRLFFVILTPSSLQFGDLFAFVRTAAYPVMWLGLLTMVVGAVMALQQNNIMRLLAFSSVSQMGYIITGIGAGAYLFGLEEAMGYSGAVMHAFNHTLFKVSFILIAGIIYFCCGELNMQKLGGLWRKLPLLSIFFILSVLAIAGVPGFNGYISKTLIHDALLEAYYHYGGLDLYLAEKVFVLGGALTLCYYLKFFTGVFCGEAPTNVLKRRPPMLLYLPFYLLVPLMPLVGIFPNFVVEEFVLISVKDFTFEPYSIEHLVGFRFFGAHPLEAALLVLLIGLLLYLPAVRMGILTRPLPHWFSIEFLLLAPLARLSLSLALRLGGFLERNVNGLYYALAAGFFNLCALLNLFDRGVDSFYDRSGGHIRQIVESFGRVDHSLNKAYDASGKVARDLAGRTTDLDDALDKSYERAGDYARRLTTRTSDLDAALDRGYEKAGSKARQFVGKKDEEEGGRLVDGEEGLAAEESSKPPKKEGKGRKRFSSWFNPLEWSIRNLNFDSLLMAVMLGLVIFVLLFFARGLL